MHEAALPMRLRTHLRVLKVGRLVVSPNAMPASSFFEQGDAAESPACSAEHTLTPCRLPRFHRPNPCQPLWPPGDNNSSDIETVIGGLIRTCLRALWQQVAGVGGGEGVACSEDAVSASRQWLADAVPVASAFDAAFDARRCNKGLVYRCPWT